MLADFRRNRRSRIDSNRDFAARDCKISSLAMSKGVIPARGGCAGSRIRMHGTIRFALVSPNRAQLCTDVDASSADHDDSVRGRAIFQSSTAPPVTDATSI